MCKVKMFKKDNIDDFFCMLFSNERSGIINFINLLIDNNTQYSR